MSVHVSTAVDTVRIAVIERGKANALDRVMVADLRRAIAGLDDTEALVITGHGTVFCGGLDNATVAGGGQASIELLRSMGSLLFQMLESPRPIVVAAPGHGVAAGAMMMLAADYTVVADRPAAFGFTEVPSGMPLPPAVIELASHRAAPHLALRLTAHGELADAQEAVAFGLAAEVVPLDRLMPTAIEHAQRLAELPAASYAATKAAVNRRVIDAMNAATG